MPEQGENRKRQPVVIVPSAFSPCPPGPRSLGKSPSEPQPWALQQHICHVLPINSACRSFGACKYGMESDCKCELLDFYQPELPVGGAAQGRGSTWRLWLLVAGLDFPWGLPGLWAPCCSSAAGVALELWPLCSR